MRRYPLTVLKFGSSVLRNDGDFSHIVHEIYRWVRAGHRVIAVASAMNNTTDKLLARAQSFGARTDERAVAALLATGEATSTALLSLALARAGVPAVALDEVRLGLRTRGPVLDAEPCTFDTNAALRALEQAPVLVIPGFVGRQDDGAISLLGRGGSDLTAIFLAHELQADRCRLVKDVDGIFEHDPADPGPAPRRYRTLPWSEAASVGHVVVQGKAIDFAGHYGQFFEVAALNSDQPSLVGSQPASFYGPLRRGEPLRIGLLGAGTVGLGVYLALAAHPEAFEITRIGVRRLTRDDGTPRALLTQDPWQVIDSECELVVELIGGLSPAKELIAAALRAGKHVITANKMVIAHHGKELRRLAEESGVQLLFSAAVGGAAPMLEQVRRIAQTRSVHKLRGVVNGTTNFILDRLAEGVPREEAVLAAQRLGLAEQNPSTDLDGSDAAHKLALLAQTAFGRWLHPTEIERKGIEAFDAESVREAAAAGHSIRLVASLDRDAGGVRARVEPQWVDRDHAFARTCNEENCLEIHPEGGEVVYVRGKGAGRWPATESVIADVFDVSRTGKSAVAETCIAAGRTL
ncbi:MAG TPA: homoserine dehydrogenase [Candidatus Angelobacter sp.]|nr:homoserine dehydrogenase [Candidatus Angelobacter sp.]